MSEPTTTRPSYEGKCLLCNSTLRKGQMTRHVKSCMGKAASQSSTNGRRKGRQKTFHVVVEGRYLREFWLHLQVSAGATLTDLDQFLRATWLECCGHLSAFRIGGTNYVSELIEPVFDFGEDDESMEIPLGRVVGPGERFYHEYDFGSTTELAVRVVSEGESGLRDQPIQMVARNDIPVVVCVSCEKTATSVCTECMYEGTGLHCDDCVGRHECDEELSLPILNSPRTGVCGYEGPGEWL